MDSSSPRIRSMLRQADRVAGTGKRAAAAKLYRQIVEEAPETTPAWIGLAGVSSDQAEKEAAYRRALELEPENEAAQNGLGALQTPNAATSETQSLESTRPITPSRETSELTDPTAADQTAMGPDQGRSETTVARNTTELEMDGVRTTTSDTNVEESGHSVLEHHEPEPAATAEVLFCANHPYRETHLRCNKCGKPICSSCARPTPVGYRCPECIREHEEIFYSASLLDYVIAAVIAFPLGLLSGILATFLGFFAIFLGAIAGTLIGRIVFRAVGRRRGRWMPDLVAVAVAIGGVLPALQWLLLLFTGQPFSIIRLLFMGIYIVAATGAAYYQMK